MFHWDQKSKYYVEHCLKECVSTTCELYEMFKFILHKHTVMKAKSLLVIHNSAF